MGLVKRKQVKVTVLCFVAPVGVVEETVARQRVVYVFLGVVAHFTEGARACQCCLRQTGAPLRALQLHRSCGLCSSQQGLRVYFFGAQGLPGAQGLSEPAFFFFFLTGPQGLSGPQGLAAPLLVSAFGASAAKADAAGATSAEATSKADRVCASLRVEVVCDAMCKVSGGVG